MVDPGRPSETSPSRSLCVGFWAVNTIAICSRTVCTANAIHGAVSGFRVYGLPCGPCGSLCTLQLSRSVFPSSLTTATLGTNGWLGLFRQGLSPCKKRQASLGAHRGRTASYPTTPAQIPACGIIAPGSSGKLAFRSSLSHMTCHPRFMPVHNPWFFNAKLLYQLVEPYPIIALALASLVELFPQ